MSILFSVPGHFLSPKLRKSGATAGSISTLKSYTFTFLRFQVAAMGCNLIQECRVKEKSVFIFEHFLGRQ